MFQPFGYVIKQRMNTLRAEIAAELFDALDEASQSIFYVIQDGIFVYGNKRGCRITGLDTPKDVYGRPSLSFVHPDDKALLADMSRKAMKGEHLQPFEWRLLTVDGNLVWVLGLLMKINFKGRPALLGNYIDITRYKQTRSELRRSSKIIEDLTIDLHCVREEERAQIAWELRENLGHTLETLKAGIEDLFGNERADNRTRSLLLHKMDAAFETVERISAHLKPPDLEHHDLLKAVKRHADEFESSTGIQLGLKTAGNFKSFAQKQTVIYFQIFRKMLKTLSGLGKVKKIDILVREDGEHLDMQFTATASGIPEKLDPNQAGSPVNTIFSQVRRRNGRLDIERKKNRFVLTATFPLARGIGNPETRILFGCGQPILTEGVRQVLSGLPDLSVVSRAETFRELIEKIGAPDFDMIIADTLILGRHSADNLGKIKDAAPYLPILVYQTTGEDDDLALRMLRHGASGYLSRSSSTDELVAAILKVAGGRKHISNRIAEKLAFEVDIYARKPFLHKLSDRERQVMFMIAEGKTMKEIASELCLSYKTIVTYRSRVFEKMNMKTNTEIVRYVVSRGLI